MDGISGMGDNDSGALTVEQQSQLNNFKIQTRLENELYLRNHSELSGVLQLFIKDVLTKRPENIREYAADYFSDKELRVKVQEQLLANQIEQPVTSKTPSS